MDSESSVPQAKSILFFQLVPVGHRSRFFGHSLLNILFVSCAIERVRSRLENHSPTQNSVKLSPPFFESLYNIQSRTHSGFSLPLYVCVRVCVVCVFDTTSHHWFIVNLQSMKTLMPFLYVLSTSPSSFIFYLSSLLHLSCIAGKLAVQGSLCMYCKRLH